MMDVSGSMGDEQKEIVRIESLLDRHLAAHASTRASRSRYIIHDAVAREVDRDTFFHTRESGGTMISSAYKLCAEIIEADYPPRAWNIYPFHFSDGDNWRADDTAALRGDAARPSSCRPVQPVLLRPGGEPLRQRPVHQGPAGGFGEDENVVALRDRRQGSHLRQSIKEFLGKGK